MQNLRFPLLSILPLLVCLAGCVQPKAVMRDTGTLPQYKRVYLLAADPDPRKVHPRILTRLQKSGFDVTEVKADRALEAQGSGFVVSKDGKLLTCAHVVQNETNVTAWIAGARHVGRVVAADTNTDLALISLEQIAEGYRPISFSSQTNYQMGEEVFTMGFPLAGMLGKQPRLGKGLISSTVGMHDDPAHLQVSVDVQPGNSGGPLLSGKGEVLGMMAATLSPANVFALSGGNLPQNVNFAIKNGLIQGFLATNNVALSYAKGDKSLGFEEAQQSVALVRAGVVEEKDLNAPTLVCRYGYVSHWDMWFRFRVFHIEFFDVGKGEWVLRAGQYADNMFSSEDGVMDRTFEEICAKLFPGRPNPFKGEKAKPKPEPKE